MSEENLNRIRDLFRLRSEECEGCPFLIEYSERLFWLGEEEGMVMCGLLGGAEGDPEEVCQLIQQEAHENEDDNDV